MKLCRKLLTSLLVLALLLSCAPVPAIAEELTEQISEELAVEESAAPDTEETNEASAVESTESVIPEETVRKVDPWAETDETVASETAAVEESFSEEIYEVEPVVIDDEELNNDDLFAGYVEKVFYGIEDVSPFSTGLNRAYNNLNAAEKQVYDALLPLFRQMANGEISSVTLDAYDGSPDASVVFTEDYDKSAPVRALQRDYPYETYWIKTTWTTRWFDYNGVLYRILYSFSVDKNFQGADEYTADTAKTGAARKAAENAKRIVNSVSYKSDYEKLCTFRDKICTLVTYDDEAAANGSAVVGRGPWEIIHAFDGDYRTNIVCGGYAKAFQYLCDMAGITCYYITGDPLPDYVPTGHAWNIVTLDDKNYHCDITWVDGEGDYWDYLFLAGGSGSIQNGYTFVGPRGQNVTYCYDLYEGCNMLEVWGEDILTLSPTNYNPSIVACKHNYTKAVTTTPYYDRDGVYTYTCTKCGNQYLETFHECWYRYTVVPPTCTEQGYTTRSCHCDKVFDNFDFKPALGHEEEVIPAKEPTCYSTGLTTGKKCTRCSLILEAQQIVDKVDHKYILSTHTCEWCGQIGGNLDGDTRWRFSENTGTLTVMGTGPMEDFTSTTQPWYKQLSKDKIKRVVLEEGVTTVGNCAFSEVDALTEVILPTTLEAVGTSAFSGCDSLTTVVLPNKVKSLGVRAFAECANLTDISLPYGITTIDNACFQDCTSMKQIYLPSTLSTLGGRAFSGCTGFTSFTIPYKVKVLNDYLFDGCTRLTEVTLPSTLEIVRDNIFSDCTGLTTLDIPDSVTAIGNRAFWGCTNLEVLELPDSLETLGSNVFFECGKLTEITIPSNLKFLGSWVFSYSGVSFVEFLGDAPEFEQYAFSNIKALVVYPGGNDTWTEAVRQQYGGTLTWMEAGIAVDKIGTCGDQLEWQYDSSSSTLTITGVGDMYDYSYQPASSDPYDYRYKGTHPWVDLAPAIQHVVIEGNVTRIGEYAFYECIGLKDIDIPNSVSFIGKSAFENCIQLNCVELPGKLKTIESSVFYGCENLRSMQIPDGVTTVSNRAFAFCTKLESLEIPNSVSVIGPSAFGFNALKEITMPRALTELGHWALERNYQLTKITFTGNAPIIEDSGRGGLLYDCRSNITIFYPANLDGWDQYVGKQFAVCTDEEESYQVTWVATSGATNYCGGDLQWSLNNNTLTISGHGAMFHYSESNPAPWVVSGNRIHTVILPEGITEIGSYAFADLSNLTEITIPNSVNDIGNSAFTNCGLEQIFFRGEGPSVAENAFSGVTADAYYLDDLTWRGNCEDYGGSLNWISTYPVTYELQDILNSNNTAAQKVIQVKNLNQLQLKHAMITEDGETAGLIKTLDTQYQTENSLNVTVEMARGISSRLSILFENVTGQDLIGAALNAKSGARTVKLVLDDAPSDLTLDNRYDSARSVLFTMTLEGVSNPKSLEVPVQITLPVPAGQDANTISILHYPTPGGEPETLIHNLNTDRSEITFVVTDFSGFAMAVPKQEPEPVSYTYGQNVQIKLIEPWGIRANAKISTSAGVVNYSSLYDYGAYFIRKSALDRADLTQSTITVADIVNDADARKLTKDNGVTVSSGYLSAIYDNDIYTYELNDSVFVMFYFITEEGADPIYVPVRERNLKDLAQQRMNDATNFPNELERTVYQKMTKLETDVTDYRSDFANLSAPEKQKAPTLAQYPLGPQAAGSQYTYGQNAQIKLIEPWGLKANVKVSKSGSVINYNAVEEYGIVALADNSKVYNTAAEILQNENAYVFSSKNGDATISNGYISATYSKDIFTYQLDTDIYVFGYVKDADGYHYGPVRNRNVYDLMMVRKDDAANFPNLKERTVYADMIVLYNAITAYREDYFKS